MKRSTKIFISRLSVPLLIVAGATHASAQQVEMNFCIADAQYRCSNNDWEIMGYPSAAVCESDLRQYCSGEQGPYQGGSWSDIEWRYCGSRIPGAC